MPSCVMNFASIITTYKIKALLTIIFRMQILDHLLNIPMLPQDTEFSWN